MPFCVKVRAFLRNLFSTRHLEVDLDEEVHSHLAMLAEERIRAGMSPEEAQRAARIELGGIEQVKERVREERVGNWLQSVVSDCRFALRQLRKNPGFTIVTVLTLALGIGANTALFTVVESVLLRPLPYAHADRLIYISPVGDNTGFPTTSWLNYRDIQEQSRSFQVVALYAEDVAVVEGKNASLSVASPRVTPNIFPMLGVEPLLGRTFTEEEGQPGGPRVVLLSEGLWRQTFDADRNVLGRTIRIDNAEHTVVGVMARDLRFPEQVGPDVRNGVWLPLQPSPVMLKERGYSLFSIVGELRLGVSQAQAQAELSAIARRLRTGDPSKFAANFGLRSTPYQEMLTGAVRPVFYGLLAAVALVLLIACANVANLLIARCLGRKQEFAMRAALGASRLRLIRQLLAEGAVLSVLGSALGLLLAQMAIAGVHKLPEATIPRGESIALHGTVIWELTAIVTLTTLLSSLLPALLVGRTNPQPALQVASRGIGSRAARNRSSGWLVAGEVALSTLLLIGTGLLFHTLWNLEHAPLGFSVARLSTFTAMPQDASGYAGMSVTEDTAHAPISVATLVYAPVLDRMRQVPGVESVALISAPPLSGIDLHADFDIAGQAKDPSVTQSARVAAVSGDYARALGTPIRAGRMVSEGDTANAPYVVVINDALAKKYFAGKDPLQQQISLGGEQTGMMRPYTIVGVLTDQADDNVGGSVEPLILLPYQQVPTTSLFYQALVKTQLSFVVKSRGDLPVAAAMRSIFHQEAPGFALDNFKTLQDVVDESIFSQRLGLYLIGIFAGLAVLMVIAGLYGVLAQLVSYRRHEIGIRIALGATRQNVARMVLREGATLIAVGLGAGILLALATGHLVTSFLYQVRPIDLWTYVAVSASLLAIGLLASLLPARKAAAIEPMQALRED
jgi:putative ABC transport system permease protein